MPKMPEDVEDLLMSLGMLQTKHVKHITTNYHLSNYRTQAEHDRNSKIYDSAVDNIKVLKTACLEKLERFYNTRGVDIDLYREVSQALERVRDIFTSYY